MPKVDLDGESAIKTEMDDRTITHVTVAEDDDEALWFHTHNGPSLKARAKPVIGGYYSFGKGFVVKGLGGIRSKKFKGIRVTANALEVTLDTSTISIPIVSHGRPAEPLSLSAELE